MSVKLPFENPIIVQPTMMRKLDNRITFFLPNRPDKIPEHTEPTIWLTLRMPAEIKSQLDFLTTNSQVHITMSIRD